jgi:hypothetical protein
MRREIFFSLLRSERERIRFYKHMYMEQENGSFSEIVVPLPSPGLGKMNRHPSLYEGNDLNEEKEEKELRKISEN